LCNNCIDTKLLEFLDGKLNVLNKSFTLNFCFFAFFYFNAEIIERFLFKSFRIVINSCRSAHLLGLFMCLIFGIGLGKSISSEIQVLVVGVVIELDGLSSKISEPDACIFEQESETSYLRLGVITFNVFG